MHVTYYDNGEGGFVAVTDECPKGFQGVLFAGKGPKRGGDVGTVHEQAFAKTWLSKLTKVSHVPPEWESAFGYTVVFDSPKQEIQGWEPRPVIEIVWSKPSREYRNATPIEALLLILWAAGTLFVLAHILS